MPRENILHSCLLAFRVDTNKVRARSLGIKTKERCVCGGYFGSAIEGTRLIGVGCGPVLSRSPALPLSSHARLASLASPPVLLD